MNKPLEFSIESDFAAVRDVQKQILDRVTHHHYTSQSMFAIKVALEEVLINAIRHGNKFDRNKKVHIKASVTPKQTEIIVEDEGEGFKRNGVPDPTLEENLTKCSGRGILLMESYMSVVEWSHGGRRVRIVRLNNDEHPAGPSTGA